MIRILYNHQLWMARSGRTTCRDRTYSLSSQGSLRHAVKAYDREAQSAYALITRDHQATD